MDKETRQWLQHQIRQVSVKWRGRSECLKKYKRKRLIGKYKNGSPKYLVEIECQVCKQWFPYKKIEVDHIQEVGEFLTWDIWLNRLFCDVSNLQPLCIICHTQKTSRFNKYRFVRDSQLEDL